MCCSFLASFSKVPIKCHAKLLALSSFTSSPVTLDKTLWPSQVPSTSLNSNTKPNLKNEKAEECCFVHSMAKWNNSEQVDKRLKRLLLAMVWRDTLFGPCSRKTELQVVLFLPTSTKEAHVPLHDEKGSQQYCNT